MFNRIRSLISAFFPKASDTRRSEAMARLRGKVRQLEGEIRARYESAVTTPENWPLWVATDYLSAKAANSYMVRRTLKLRSRYEADNNSYMRGMIDTIVDDLVGTGPTFEGCDEDLKLNKAVERRWNEWAEAIDLGDDLRVMGKGKVQDGEGCGLIVNNDTLRETIGGTLDVEDAVQLDIAAVESDQMTTPDPGYVDYFWVDGIVLNKLGQPKEYHFLRHHPGDLFIPQLNPMVYDRWKARDVIHWFKKSRPGQVRGVPECTPGLELFAMLRRYTKAVVAAAETAAEIAILLESEAAAYDGSQGPNPDTGEPWEHVPLERGSQMVLPRGYKGHGFEGTQPTTTYEMFVRILMREICRCLQIPLSLALGDTSGSNYSSARMEHLAYHRAQRVERHRTVRDVLDKIFRAWWAEARLIRGYFGMGVPAVPIARRWHWANSQSIDPVKDATADQLELGNNTTTLAEIYARRGLNWEQQLRQRGREMDLIKELGLAPEVVESAQGVKARALAVALRQYDPDTEDGAEKIADILTGRMAA